MCLTATRAETSALFQFLSVTDKAAVYRLCEHKFLFLRLLLCFSFFSSLILYSDILLDLDSPAPVTTPAPAPVSAGNDLWGDFSTAPRYNRGAARVLSVGVWVVCAGR